jgi:hypothetical protein
VGVYSRVFSCLILMGGLIAGTVAMAGGAGAAVAGGHGAAVCTGTPQSPGVLAGFYKSDVVVVGACEVNAGPAVVRGDLTLSPGSALVAAFALNHHTQKGTSSLTVRGDLRVRNGAALVLGCEPQHFACIDDPNQNAPTLSSHARVSGDMTSQQALGVVVHNTSIGGDIRQRGGGGGVNCTPTGIFAQFGSPVFSAYEDSSVGGEVSISGLRSCWLGVARVHVRDDVSFVRNQLADPDAIEILANHIRGDLACFGNSMVWNSADISPTGDLFPRQPEPNTVNGHRRGQCVLASPLTPGGPLGPGPF